MDQLHDPGCMPLAFSIRSVLEEIGPAVDRILAHCRRVICVASADDDLFLKLEISAAEAITNIVKHSYDLNQQCWVDIVVEPSVTLVKIVLCDSGRELVGGIDHLGLHIEVGDDLDSLPVCGMGWYLIKMNMDSVEYVRVGDENRLTMVKNLC